MCPQNSICSPAAPGPFWAAASAGRWAVVVVCAGRRGVAGGLTPPERRPTRDSSNRGSQAAAAAAATAAVARRPQKCSSGGMCSQAGACESCRCRAGWTSWRPCATGGLTSSRFLTPSFILHPAYCAYSLNHPTPTLQGAALGLWALGLVVALLATGFATSPEAAQARGRLEVVNVGEFAGHEAAFSGGRDRPPGC